MNANEIARNFYAQKNISTRFITAKQCDWLMRTARSDKQDFRDHRGGAKGQFKIDGKTYCWELNVIKYGAGSFTVTTPAEIDEFNQELKQRAADHKSLLMDWALDSMADQDYPASRFIPYNIQLHMTRTDLVIYESDWLS